MPKSIASTAAPDLPHDVDLPTEYKAKRCKWCKNWSSSLCPWPLQNTVLSAWSPLLPWHRGSRNKPIGDACKVCMVVWTQGGYEAEYAAEERFHKCCDSNPTLLHSFLDKRSAVIRMKKADPNMRFRVETNLGPAMSLTSSKSSEQGLEAPEVFWVELSEYEQEFGAANPDDIVVETVDGKTVQGVNVMTGRKGWHRRINKSSTQVKRSAEFSDGVAIDDGAGMDKLEQAIKKATLKSTKIAKVATFHHTGSAGSTSDCRVGAESHRAHDESHEDMHAGESDPDRTNDQSDDSDDDMPGVGLSNFLKSFNAASSSRSLDAPSSTAAPKSKAAAKPKAASVKAKAKHSGPAASSSDGASQKVAVGNAGTVSSKRKVVVVDPFVAGGDDASTSPEKKKLREVDDLTEADANTVQTFNSKLDPLKLVGPPIADAAFKTYMTDQIQKATQLITELRIKKKSADRRNGSKTKTNKADIMFLEKLTEVETEVKEVQKLLRCLAGQISLDADRTLLQALDEAASKRNMSFNSSVIRKALKIAMYDNLKLCQFNEMANETYELISARFITDDDNTNVTSDDFYSMVCGQVLQKLAKTAQSKVRSKEPIFAPCNKKETSLMDQFFTALVSSSKIPTSLGGDAQDLLNLLKAEVNSVTAVRVSLDKMNQQTNSDASNGPLSGMLLGTTLGTKLVGDAQLALEARSVDTEMTENLERIFAELPTMYSNLEGCDESTIKAKCSSLSEAHNTLIEFMKNKQRVKSLGKDGLSKKQTSLRNAAALLMMHSAIHDVKPWLTDASAPMTSTQLISELTCKAVQDLIKLQDFATLKAVMSSSSALSKALVTIKSQTGDDSGSTSALNIALSTFTIAVKNFEAYFTKSAFSASLPNDVKVLFADTNVFTVSLNIFLERMNEKDINRVLRALGQSLKTLCDGEVSEKCIADTNSAIERLQLSAAALPHDSMHRVPALQSADFLIVFVKAAGAHKSCNTSKPEDASMKILVKSMAELNSYKSLKDTVNMVISTIGNGASNDADKTLLPTAEMLVTTIESLMTSYSALEKTWVDIMVAEMDTIMTKIDGYKIPNTKNIEYTPSDTNTLPSLQNDFPELNDLDPNSAALVQVAADLRSLLGRVKDVGLVEKVEPYTKASSAHTNSLTALAIIAIVKVFQIKRFRKAVEAKQPIPQNLLESLADTMQTCKDVSPPLEIPPALQAQVSSFSNKASSGAGQQP